MKILISIPSFIKTHVVISITIVVVGAGAIATPIIIHEVYKKDPIKEEIKEPSNEGPKESNTEEKNEEEPENKSSDKNEDKPTISKPESPETPTVKPSEPEKEPDYSGNYGGLIECEENPDSEFCKKVQIEDAFSVLMDNNQYTWKSITYKGKELIKRSSTIIKFYPDEKVGIYTFNENLIKTMTKEEKEYLKNEFYHTNLSEWEWDLQTCNRLLPEVEDFVEKTKEAIKKAEAENDLKTLEAEKEYLAKYEPDLINIKKAKQSVETLISLMK